MFALKPKIEVRITVKQSTKKLRRIGGQAILLLFFATDPVAAAVQDQLPCTVPDSLSPLFSLLDTFTQLAFLGGVGLATFGFSAAALLIIAPGEDYSRRGKLVAKSVLIGTLLLLSANMIVGFLVNELGVTICT